MIFHNYKKTLAIAGIIVLFPTIFFFAPKKAEAIVPVSDAGATAALIAIKGSAAATAVAGGSMVKKEYILDSIAYAIAGQVLHALTQSTVNWIRSGFQGNPLFITDFEGFLKDQADQATGVFMKEFLSPEIYNAICSPWRQSLQIALLRKYTFADRMRCTLNTVIKNAEDFARDVHDGDWDNWIRVTGNPQNNPYGSFIIASDQLAAIQAAATERAKTESIFNLGFKGLKQCTEYGYNDWTGEKFCMKETTVSPGKWISDTLQSSTGVDFQRLGMADELNEIFSALISQLLTGILKR